jgi:hypothetical protein
MGNGVGPPGVLRNEAGSEDETGPEVPEAANEFETPEAERWSDVPEPEA